MKTLIKNAVIVNSDETIKANILLEDEIISQITNEEKIADKTIDASGLFVVPGLIDMHTHFRDPGQEYKDDIISCSETAIAGGVTTAMCMANTTPINDNASITRQMIAKAKARGLIDLLPIGAISKGFNGDAIVEMGDMIEAGAVAFSDDGLPVSSSLVMRSALEYSAHFGSFVINHSEDCSLCRHGVMNEGKVAAKLGLKGMPKEQEEIMISRDLLLAKLTGGHIHVAHVSSAWSLKLIQMAKNEGINVTCEVTPHHFTFSEEELYDYNTAFKMSPPLRTNEDIISIKNGLKSGLIDVIATDHAPHSWDDKFIEFDKAPFGILGLQTLIPLTLKLVEEGVISMQKFVELTSTNAAKILRIKNKGKIAPNFLADITIIDPNLEYIYDENLNKSKSTNSPLFGKKLKGSAVKTIKNGKIVFDFPNVIE
ncbi:dihydroorotase [Campylobacter sputorum subsp. bubulus]|uniref:Dihydroorotase n=1 Tax=Campylobacter sputorum subsp. sputorum TaxID=32024 RepID=A0A381DJ26_9BACT|nr:dihydroorotase [Campylobacter sputorum]ASM35735.1 dihydroorotase, multifunctional complex type [Campylobacter sputorum aubsp. sputorum RM3237]ASM37454.1 dihydroorotase, multifunctional complex type [Campylobacter sputorum bv. faecalis CCUG 20703]ASM39117.1 dihydroorotase, multifunctional complex type [Campylobacter sputorum bv. paraureolyticus LMG 11764]KAB0580670.1 dihydroorotase [Campylobacter sputorum subsp. sputorum]MDY6120127.1 dihydroorotase [Campylobacter sputorum]